ncbi:MAG: hypothetical protein ACK5XN_09985 [Bacteroidota bacterium]|jgi:hypothetical protein
MKLIKLEILSNVIDKESNENNSYKELLEELNLPNPDYLPNENSYFRPAWLNLKTLEDEILSIYERLDCPDNSIMEYFDGRTMIVNMSPENLIQLLNDTK